ncbi:hypothetical protein I3760_09G146600 [Carya illinoinensis]|nr:hypothetical protein I3760_09G146600 [Carya illinoinensis]
MFIFNGGGLFLLAAADHLLTTWSNHRILIPEYGYMHLELIPMLVGFFTYKIATFVQRGITSSWGKNPHSVVDFRPSLNSQYK